MPSRSNGFFLLKPPPTPPFTSDEATEKPPVSNATQGGQQRLWPFAAGFYDDRERFLALEHIGAGLALTLVQGGSM